MNKFIKNVLIFSIVFFILIIIFHFSLIRNRDVTLKLPPSKNTVFIGNSTIECSVQDSLLISGFNFGRSSETLDCIYARIQLLKENNPSLNTIYLGFDDIILNNTTSIETANPYYLDKFSVDDWITNFTKYPLSRNYDFWLHLYKPTKIMNLAVSNFKDVEILNLNLGKYLRLNGSKVEKDIKNRINKPKEAINGKIPEVSKYYLDKIIAFCQKSNIEIRFLHTPYFSVAQNDTNYRVIHRLYYSDIKLIDDMNYEMPESYFYDCIHLNYKGAEEYTKHLIKNLSTQH